MGEALIIKTRGEWVKQVEDATAAWESMDPKPKNLDALAEENYQAFCKLVEGYHALGFKVSDELMSKAKMVPVSEALGLP